MRLRNLLNVVIIGILIPQLALAQTPPVVPEVPDTTLVLKNDFTPQVAVVANVEGVWFNNVDAQYLLYMRRELVPNLLKLDSQNAQMVTDLRKQMALMGQIGDLQGGQVALVKDQLVLTNKELEKCRDEKDSLWRSPLFIAGLAFLAGMLVTGTVVYLTK